jgi:putative ABC transport system permease protein
MADFRYAWRSLLRTPGFTIACLLTLALGIGAATTIFNLANAALFKPVPYADPGRLLILTMGGRPAAFDGRQFLELRDRVQQLDAVAAQGLSGSFNLVTDRSAAYVTGLRVTKDYFRVLRASPLGRAFIEAEVTPGGPDAVVISDDLWGRAFQRRADTIGRTIRLGSVAHTIVGIMPAGFRSIPAADIVLPLRTTARDTGRNYTVLGRLRNGASLAATQAELDRWRTDTLGDRSGVDDRSGPRPSWVPYRDILGSAVRQPLFVMMGAVGALLLIACVNVASLNIARAIGRQREMATRAALGAPFGRLLRSLCFESLVIAIASGAMGLLLAKAGTSLLLSLGSEDLSREYLSGATPAFDWRVLVAAVALTLVTGLLFGMAPTAILWRLKSQNPLSQGVRTTASRHSARMRRGLAIAEVALAVVLLVSAGLLIQTFVKLTNVEKGFNPDGVLVGWMSLQGTSVETSDARARLFDQALERIRALPGVRLAAVSNQVPIESGLNLALQPPPGASITRSRAVDWRYITPEYFSIFDIAIRAGRAFESADGPAAPPVVIVNEAFARAYFGRIDVIGETIQLDPQFRDSPREIVGVSADVKARSNAGFVINRGVNALADPVAPTVFAPAAQAPDSAIRVAHRFFPMKWIIKTDGAPSGALQNDIREAVRAVDASLPFIRFAPMVTVISDALAFQRLVTVLLVVFAGLAMLLAAIGLFSVVAYSASQRRREIGVRIAVGATGLRVGRLFLLEGVSVATIGLALGTLGAIGATRVLINRLFGVTPLDVPTFVATAALLLAVATGAAMLPALRAARTNPVEALRAE